MRTLLLYNVDPSWAPEEQDSVTRESHRLGHAIRRQGHSVVFSPLADHGLESLLSAFDPSHYIVFNWCEGLPGLARSEAVVPQILERMRFTYTGAPAESIQLSYDKVRVKELLRERGVPTPRWQVYTGAPDGEWDCFPAIVKPACEHCSFGIGPESVVASKDELRRRVDYILREYRQPALVEDFIDGREFHVPVLGNGNSEMLPPVEMDFSQLGDVHDRLCSFDAKFVPESAAYKNIRSIVPARLNAEDMKTLEQVSIGAYEALGCRDYGRIDVRLRDGVFYVLDVNPNADISADASMAVAAEKAGYCYGALGSRVLELAAQRHPQNLAPHQ